MLRLGVNGGLVFGGMSGHRRVGQLRFGRYHVHGSNHNEILTWCTVIESTVIFNWEALCISVCL